MTKEITPARIKELRDRTGVGMGKCKEALEVAHGDLELAITNLRKAGMAGAVKKEGRTANEGKIAIAENSHTIALVEVNAETDFVVRNDRFQHFVRDIAEEVLKTKPASLETFKNQKFSKDPAHTVDESRALLVQTIGENIQIRRLIVLHKEPAKSIGVYSHMGGKLVTVVEISGSNAEEEFAKDIAMHVAAGVPVAPEYVSEKDVPASVIAHEKEVAAGQVKGKPENIINKIVEGKLNAYFDGICLLRQKYIRDDSLSIQDLINQRSKSSGKHLSLAKFYRLVVGQ